MIISSISVKAPKNILVKKIPKSANKIQLKTPSSRPWLAAQSPFYSLVPVPSIHSVQTLHKNNMIFTVSLNFLPQLKFYRAFFYWSALDWIYSSIDFAACFPAPMARITVAAPVTASPPAYTPSLVVCKVLSSTMMQPFLLASRPSVVLRISGFGELPMAMQTKLLTFLDDRKFKRIGALEDTAVDVRIIAATNRNLEEAIKAGQFREDLFYRLNVMQIEIPPLRDRREDIPVLCDYYLDYYNKAFARNIEKVDPDFMRELLLYDWKGNVRELKNIFERCFLFSQGNILEKHVELAPVEREARPESGDCIYLKDLKKGPIDLEQEVAALEKRYMSEALKLSGNNLTRAAALLGVTRFSMKRKMEREDGEK